MESNDRCERLMVPLFATHAGAKISTLLYNRVYEAVVQLSDGCAERLVKAIADELRSLDTSPTVDDPSQQPPIQPTSP